MRAPHKVIGGLLACVGWVTIAGCTSHGGTIQPSPSTPLPAEARLATPKATASPTAVLPSGSAPAEMDAADFSTDITNRYWPMKPGNTLDLP